MLLAMISINVPAVIRVRRRDNSRPLQEDVDDRAKSGHDGGGQIASIQFVVAQQRAQGLYVGQHDAAIRKPQPTGIAAPPAPIVCR